MMPKSMDSLDIVQMVMMVEEIFGVEIPDNDAEGLGSPPEIVDWLEIHLANQRPNKRAVAFLKKLANDNQNPEMAEGIEGTWRREQIAAIISELYKVVR